MALADTVDLSDKMMKLKKERDSATEHQERKHEDWNDNYELYRNKVATNRLTQRQAVNLPLMKETIKTVLSKIDDPPIVEWKEKSGDEMKELIFQEMWNESYKEQKLDWLDVVDKKNVLLYGLSVKKLNPVDDSIEISVMDVFDIVFDPLMNPTDIESARFIVHQNIFRTVREILADPRYDSKAKKELEKWAETPEAMVLSEENREQFDKKMERAEAMGVQHKDFPHFAAGDTIVALTEHYTTEWNGSEFERRVVVYADKWLELMDERLEDLIGTSDYPFVVWYEDPETNDIYPDGVADLVRTPNKVVNVWYSQLIENRTLSNFRMHWYNSETGDYTPQTYEPGPGRMLPAPGNPKEVIMPVEINGLDESLTAIDFVTRVIERGTGAVAIDKGVQEASNQTLGEVEILVGKAMERSIALQKFYRASWYELCTKWADLKHANPGKKTSLYKTGRSGKLYEKVVFPKDWKSTAGYEPIVSSSSEQEANDIKTIQKFNFVIQQSPNNMALRKIAQRRQLELLDLTPDELKEIQDAEEEAAQQAQLLAQQGADTNAAQPEEPAVNPELQSLEDSLAALGA